MSTKSKLNPVQQAVQRVREAREGRNLKFAIKESSAKSLKPEDMTLESFDYNHERRDVSRYHVARKKLATYVGLKYSYVDHIINYGEELEMKEPEAPEAKSLTPINDPYSIQKDRYKDKLRAHDKKLEKYEKQTRQTKCL